MRTPEQFLSTVTFVTYHSANAASHETWVAYPFFNGEQWLVRSIGNTEAEALAKAKELIKKEANKQYGLVGNVIPEMDEAKHTSTSKPSVEAPKGRGQVFLGKVWVGNPKTKEKKRVDESEVAGLLASGWIKAGPRTQL